MSTFSIEPTAVPPTVIAYVAAQLGIHDVTCLAKCGARSNTAWEHAAEIRRVYGYREFSNPSVWFPLVRWLYTRAWLSAEQPSVLFDLATAWLVQRQALLPGVSVLVRLVARIRERANARLYVKLARGGQLKSEAQPVVDSSPHVDQLTVGIVKVEIGSKLLMRWRTNEVTVCLFLGVSEEFGRHRRRSLRRR
ncbi:MAG: DUF4158 domain-containing protein [Chloroflexi bacterium]|nr:DUF4158 domain-containing protein [Chloroflexota bacterium]